MEKQEQTAVLDESREEATVLNNVRQSVSNKAFEETIVATFESIMEHSRTYQKESIGGIMMDGVTRREAIIKQLRVAEKPISAVN